MKKLAPISIVILLATACLIWGVFFRQSLPGSAASAANLPKVEVSTAHILHLLDGDRDGVEQSGRYIVQHYEPSQRVMLLEVMRFANGTPLDMPLVDLIQQVTSAEEPFASHKHFEDIWREPYTPASDYPEFKARLYSRVDSRFTEYFNSKHAATIRLDEVIWGGVRRDGIPPLETPAMIPANEAGYLHDDHIVFGIEINGDARAYPKRVLAWHEMFRDDVGGVPVNGVYCTLCGSMIVYETKLGPTQHQLGTSGFLYRSNKLMYDLATKSLWSTLRGEPVVGPLVGQGIRLKRRSVVTTTWGEWRATHPKTSVLSLTTGHIRDYSEGAAYRQYFSTDRLMFYVPKLDARLPNKHEVLALRNDAEQLAISSDFLKAHPVYHEKLGDQELAILTTSAGANRVYACGPHRFKSWTEMKAVDETGVEWVVAEDEMTSPTESLPRVPAHRVFWFAWQSFYPETRLVHVESKE